MFGVMLFIAGLQLTPNLSALKQQTFIISQLLRVRSLAMAKLGSVLRVS